MIVGVERFDVKGLLSIGLEENGIVVGSGSDAAGGAFN